MRVLNLPPATRFLVATLLVCTTSVLLLRMNAYHVLLSRAKGPQIQPETDERPVPTPELPLFKDIVVPYMTVVTPALSLLYPWVVLTTSFVETSVVGFLVTGATLVFGGKYCERVWNTKTLAWFVGLQSVVPVLVTASLLVLKYMLTVATGGNTDSVVHVVSGGTAIQLGFLVALKQLVPEHSIVLFRGAFTVKVKHLVMPVLILYTIAGVAILGRSEIALLAWSGFFTAWIYLRFFRVTYVDPILPSSAGESSAGDGSGQSSKAGPGKTRIKGDASEVFALSTFFYPGPLRDVIHQASRVVFHALVAIKVCTPFNQDEVEQGNLRARMRTSGRTVSNGGDGQKTAAEIDAERRRAIALKVLEERLDNTRRS